MHTITQNSHTSSEGNLPNSFLHTVVTILSKYHFSIKSYAVLNESHRMNKSIVLCHKFMIISILQRNDTHARTHNDITQYPTLFGIINYFHNVAIVIRHDKFSGSSSPRSSSPRRRQVCDDKLIRKCSKLVYFICDNTIV